MAERVRSSLSSSWCQDLVVSNLVFTDVILGRGAYETVYEVEWNRTVCVAMRLHDILLEDESSGGAEQFIDKIEAECLLWSKLRHPNVVQFLGVYLERGSRLPVLVMEKMDTSLCQYLESHSKEDFPLGLKAFVLRQVAQALAYLHNQDPPLIHHNLSPNTVLLNIVSFVTKVTGFAMSRVISRNTSNQDTLALVSPEAVSECPRFDMKLDVFSFGSIIMHTLTHEWPNPGPPTRYEGERFVAINEFQRHVHLIEAFTAQENQLFSQIICQCLENRPEKRPSSAVLVQEMRRIESTLPRDGHVAAPFEQLLQQLSAKEEECRQQKKKLKEKDEVIKEKNSAIKAKDEELQHLKDDVIRRLEAENQELRNQSSQTSEGGATGKTCHPGADSTVDKSTEGEPCCPVQHCLRDWRALGDCQRIIQHSPEGSRYFAVAVNSEGLLAVTDGGNNCVQLLTKEGTLVQTIGKGVFGGGFLYSVVYHLYAGTLVGVAFDGKGDVWVSTGLSGKVVKLSQDGRLLRTIQHAGSERDSLYPTGVSVSPENRIYICDLGKHRITVHDEDGKFLFDFGSYGTGLWCFNEPQDLAFGSDGLVYVTDTENERVCVWSKEGTFVRYFSTKNAPLHIAATGDGHVLISSSCVIMVYTLKGKLVHEFGKKGYDPGEFHKPLGICVDDTGLVFVADRSNKRVQVF